MTRQITIDDLIQKSINRYKSRWIGCGDCRCRTCLYLWSSRCPFGGCFDDWRAVNDPYPGEVRKAWSDWNKPGEQDHWCRGGQFFEAGECERYVRYDESKRVIKECVGCNVVVFQDGYIMCSMIDTLGCEKCIETYMPEEEE